MYAVFNSFQEAQNYQESIDSALGYPITIEVMHNLEPITMQHWGNIIKHNSLDIWAHPFNDNFDAITIPELDASWYPKSLTVATPVSDWEALNNALRGSMIFGKAFLTANNNAWALLLTSLQVSNNINDFDFAMKEVRIAMPYPLSSVEIAWFNDLLASCNLPIVIDDDTVIEESKVQLAATQAFLANN